MTILITGANRGIGAALLAGYRAQGVAALGTARRAQAGLLPLDVRDEASHRALAAQLDGQAIDLLVCNAGIYPDGGESIDHGYAPAMWAEVLATNVTGVFLTIQHLLPNLRLAKAPRIAIISSVMGSSETSAGGSYIYRASKAAAVNLGRNLAHDLGPERIAVGIYHPGWVQSDMGGSGASISTTESASGLMARFAALSPATTGRFETWDGRPIPF